MKKLLIKTSLVLALPLLAFFILPIYQQDYVLFQNSLYSVEEYVNTTHSEYERLSEVMWVVRSYDVIVLSLLLFVAAVCCTSMLLTDSSRKD